MSRAQPCMSPQVRSPGQIKWPNLRKNFQSCHNHSGGNKYFKLQDLVYYRVPTTCVSRIFYIGYLRSGNHLSISYRYRRIIDTLPISMAHRYFADIDTLSIFILYRYWYLIDDLSMSMFYRYRCLIDSLWTSKSYRYIIKALSISTPYRYLIDIVGLSKKNILMLYGYLIDHFPLLLWFQTNLRSGHALAWPAQVACRRKNIGADTMYNQGSYNRPLYQLGLKGTIGWLTGRPEGQAVRHSFFYQ